MLKGKKTFIFAILLAILGGLEAMDFTNFLNDSTAGIVTIVISGAIAALRTVTNTPALKDK